MGFWIFMLITSLICPIIMIISGLYFIKNSPKRINRFIGYRTQMSMKNENTWSFAHKYIGKLWLILGTILVLPSLIPMLFVIGKSEEIISVVSLISCFVGIAALFVSIIFTEIALRKSFDKDGNELV